MLWTYLCYNNRRVWTFFERLSFFSEVVLVERGGLELPTSCSPRPKDFLLTQSSPPQLGELIEELGSKLAWSNFSKERKKKLVGCWLQNLVVNLLIVLTIKGSEPVLGSCILLLIRIKIDRLRAQLPSSAALSKRFHFDPNPHPFTGNRSCNAGIFTYLKIRNSWSSGVYNPLPPIKATLHLSQRPLGTHDSSVILTIYRTSESYLKRPPQCR